MITETTKIEAEYYDYRLVTPTGSIVDRTLPLFLGSGDVLLLEGEPDYRVMLCDPTSVYVRVNVFL